MPRRDGTGPMGLGSMSGRGLGVCLSVDAVKDDSNFTPRRMGLACRRGCGRGFGVNRFSSKSPKERLEEQKRCCKTN